MKRSVQALTSVLLIWLGSLACVLPSLFARPADPTGPAATPTALSTRTPPVTSTASATPRPAPSPFSLDQVVRLDFTTASESGQAPPYTLTTRTPVLQGSDDPHVQQFNQAVAALVQADVQSFKDGLTEVPPDAPSGSYFDLDFALLSPPGDLLSLQFKIDGYAAGAAHPYHYTQTFNYQLSSGEQLALGQLFQQGTDYLAFLAAFCDSELRQRLGEAYFPDGAQPSQENYRNWNLTPDGLLLSFDEYQVAPYAAGPQSVLIPYAVLQTIANPQGPLATFLP